MTNCEVIHKFYLHSTTLIIFGVEVKTQLQWSWGLFFYIFCKQEDIVGLYGFNDNMNTDTKYM